jgi:hypothetical protein
MNTISAEQKRISGCGVQRHDAELLPSPHAHRYPVNGVLA